MANINFKALLLALVLATSGASMAGCGLSDATDSELSEISVEDILNENSDNVLIDEHLNGVSFTTVENDDLKEISLIEAISFLEEVIRLYDFLPDTELKGVFIPKENEEFMEYIIQPGDTLSTIALKFNTSIDKIREDNQVGAVIYAGDVLKIKENSIFTPISIDEAQLLIEVWQSDNSTDEEKIAAAQRIYLEKERCAEWLRANGDNILEEAGIIIVKSSVVNACDYPIEKISDVKIRNENDAQEYEDIVIKDVSTNFLGNSENYDVNLDNDSALGTLLYNIYRHQTADKNEPTDEMLRRYRSTLEQFKEIIGSEQVIENGIFGDYVTLKK